MLFLVTLDHKYGERIPVQVGTHVIAHLVVIITEKELQLGKPGNRYISAV